MKYELTAYELSIINGGFTIVGVLLGTVITYWLSRFVTAHSVRINAITALRRTFAPQLSYLKSFEGFTEGTDNIRDKLYSAFQSMHAAELENFRFFVKNKNIEAYDKACEKYQELLHPGLFVNVGDQEPSEFFIAQIRSLLNFTL